MTNKEIHHRFRELGRDHRRIVNELVSMLPEISRRGFFGNMAVFPFTNMLVNLEGFLIALCKKRCGWRKSWWKLRGSGKR